MKALRMTLAISIMMFLTYLSCASKPKISSNNEYRKPEISEPYKIIRMKYPYCFLGIAQSTNNDSVDAKEIAGLRAKLNLAQSVAVEIFSMKKSVFVEINNTIVEDNFDRLIILSLKTNFSHLVKPRMAKELQLEKNGKYKATMFVQVNRKDHMKRLKKEYPELLHPKTSEIISRFISNLDNIEKIIRESDYSISVADSVDLK